MGKRSESIPMRRHARRHSSRAGSAILAELADRFARFRSEHPRRTRVPIELRAATLAALRRGVTRGDLYRSCGVSWSQLEAWESGFKSVDNEAATEDVRIFSVVDEEPADRRAAEIGVEQELELRLGRWSVRVRLADPGTE